MKEIEEKIKKLEEELRQAIDQINLWTVRRIKAEGAIEVLKTLLTEPVKKDK